MQCLGVRWCSQNRAKIVLSGLQDTLGFHTMALQHEDFLLIMHRGLVRVVIHCLLIILGYPAPLAHLLEVERLERKVMSP